MTARRSLSGWVTWAAVAGAALLALASCGKKDKDAAATEPNRAPPFPASLPRYSLPRELEQQHPEVVDFLKQFVETCYVGDYGSYRLLVARAVNPESRERFEAIIRAIDNIDVESITPIDQPPPPWSPPAYLVVTHVDFKPDSRIALRRASRRLAILVVQEEGEWRIAPAPASAQPRDAPPTSAPVSQPAEKTYFPWDTDGGP